MKLKITETGAEGFAVGSTVEIEGDTIPPSLVNKCFIVDNAAPKTMIVNPAPDEKDELIEQAKELGIEANRRWSVKRLQEAIDAKLGE